MGSRSWSRRNRKMFMDNLEDRYCPPVDELLKENEYVQRHLEICPTCQKRLEEAKSFPINGSFEFNAEIFSKDYPLKKGTICKLSYPNVSKWDKKGLYHNDPSVVVLELYDKLATVSLINDMGIFLDLKNQEEVGLFSEDREDFFGYAECWNVFSVPKELLCYYSRAISEETISLIQKKRNDNNFKDLPVDSSNYLFHQMEAMVGAYYSKSIFSMDLS